MAAYDSRDLTLQRTSGHIVSGVTNQVIKSTEGKIFTVSMIATSAGGYIEVFDASSKPSSLTADMLVELRDGVANDSKGMIYSPYLQATKGIVITTVNATAIVTYY